MKLTPLFIGIIVLSGVMLGWSVIFGGVQTVYDVGGDANTSTFENFTQAFAEVNSSLQKIENLTVGVATKDWTDWTRYQDILFIFVEVGGALLDIPNTVVRFINMALGFAPIPKELEWFGRMIFLIVLAIAVLRVAAIFTKTDEI